MRPLVAGRRRWPRRAAVVAVAVLGLGLPADARVEAGPLPGSCKLHPVHVVNPGCVPTLADQAGEGVDEVTGPVLAEPITYPDLVPTVTEAFVFRPAIGFNFETNTFIFGPPELWFDTWSQNLGTVALDLMTDDPSNLTNPPAAQCVSWNPDHVCRQRQRVGGFELHPAHGHFHFSDFGRYELRRLLADGSVDYSDAGLVDRSEKVSFCLIDSTRVRDDALLVPTYVLCTGQREGISAGWADIYTSDLPGQQLSLAGLADGRYALVVGMNSAGHVLESEYGNNTVEVIVELSGGVTQGTIVERRWP